MDLESKIQVVFDAGDAIRAVDTLEQKLLRMGTSVDGAVSKIEKAFNRLAAAMEKSASASESSSSRVRRAKQNMAQAVDEMARTIDQAATRAATAYDRIIAAQNRLIAASRQPLLLGHGRVFQQGYDPSVYGSVMQSRAFPGGVFGPTQTFLMGAGGAFAGSALATTNRGFTGGPVPPSFAMAPAYGVGVPATYMNGIYMGPRAQAPFINVQATPISSSPWSRAWNSLSQSISIPGYGIGTGGFGQPGGMFAGSGIGAGAGSIGAAFGSSPLLAGLAGYFGVERAIAGGRSLLETSSQFQRIENTLSAVAGSSRDAKNEFAFLQAETDRLGINFVRTAESFARFSAAAKEGGAECISSSGCFQRYQRGLASPLLDRARNRGGV